MYYLYLIIINFVILLKEIESNHNDNSTCGRPLGSEFRLAHDRIIGGYDVGYYRYPWFGMLMKNNSSVCGATLIGPRSLVTAAHCYKKYLKQASNGHIRLEDIYTLRMGSYNSCITEPTRRDYKIEKVYIHKKYYTKKPYYDIALLTVNNETDAFTPICLPEINVKKPKDGTVMGMGTIKFNGAKPCTIHEARILINSEDECKQMVNGTGNNAESVQKVFCAAYTEGDTCQGDGGSPFQVINDEGDYVILGVTSFGFRCEKAGDPGIYTDISNFLGWIKEKSNLDVQYVLKPSKNIDQNTQKPTSWPLSNIQDVTPDVTSYEPYKKVIKIIIFRNGQYTTIRRPVLHIPIKRN